MPDDTFTYIPNLEPGPESESNPQRWGTRQAYLPSLAEAETLIGQCEGKSYGEIMAEINPRRLWLAILSIRKKCQPGDDSYRRTETVRAVMEQGERDEHKQRGEDHGN